MILIGLFYQIFVFIFEWNWNSERNNDYIYEGDTPIIFNGMQEGTSQSFFALYTNRNC